MEYTIRKATKADATAAHQLIVELAIFEKAPNAVTNTIEQFTKDGFGENPIYNLIVAETNNKQIVGMALYFYAYSTWKGKMLYLDDLIVTQSWRNKGIGKKLIDELFVIAKENNANIVKWEVLDWNTPAIEFYKKLGAKIDKEWWACKFYAPQIEELSKVKKISESI